MNEYLIIDAHPQDAQWLWVRYGDGLVGKIHIDCTGLPALLGNAAADEFAQARLHAGTVAWPCGIQLDAAVGRLKIEDWGCWAPRLIR